MYALKIMQTSYRSQRTFQKGTYIIYTYTHAYAFICITIQCEQPKSPTAGDAHDVETDVSKEICIFLSALWIYRLKHKLAIVCTIQNARVPSSGGYVRAPHLPGCLAVTVAQVTNSCSVHCAPGSLSSPPFVLSGRIIHGHSPSKRESVFGSQPY